MSAFRMVLIGPPTVHSARWKSEFERRGWVVVRAAYGAPDLTADAHFAEVAIETGGRFTLVRTAAGLRREARRLARFVEQHRADVVCAHWFLGPAWLAAFGSAGRPVVATAWGSDVLLPFPGRSRATLVNRVAQRRFDVVTYDAELVRTALRSLGVDERRLERIVFGPDASRFKPGPPSSELLESLGVSIGDPVILSPRGLAPVYAPDTVLRAFALAAPRAPGTLLVHVRPGEDELWDGLQYLVPPEIAQRVVPYRGVEPDQLPALLNSAAVVVSVPESDGTSVTLLEALFCERPVVVSDIPANREWVSNGTRGRLVPIREPAALGNALQAIIADPAGAGECARRAAVDARPRADGRRQFDRAAEVAERVVRGHRTRGSSALSR
jgi:glycosyltransferase involved in cell wall biosynthesis